MPPPVPPSPTAAQFPCTSCGAALVFAPGTRSLTCGYCGAVNDIPVLPDLLEVEEQDFESELAAIEEHAPRGEILAVKCNTCGAESTLAVNQTAGTCPFCGQPVVAQMRSTKPIKPQALLPFHITPTQATASFRTWLGSLWFAPSDLKTYADRGGLKGIYTPAWTYDCRTATRYAGYRGDDYWTTETYTVFINGRPSIRTRQVRRTRWSPASGRVRNTFDDVLVMASHSLPEDSLEKLRPWDLGSVVPYQDEFLSGFVAESYQTDLAQGFGEAKTLMAPTIESTIRSDIGGDHQRITDTATQYADITFKHLLLPVWLSSYRYRDKTYRFLVNARTGEAAGDRPYSPWKITAAVLLSLIVLTVILLAIAHNQ